jgi:putative photosynthetic complex assembly protein
MSHAQTTPRLRRTDTELVPRAMVRAVGALMLTTLTLVTVYRLADGPLVASPPAEAVVISRDVVLSGDLAGAARVTAPDGTLIADLSPAEGGFVSGVYRVILRERLKHGVPVDAPVTLNGRDNGRISIHDPSTGWSADLMGFGADNARAFARLLAQHQGGQ